MKRLLLSFLCLLAWNCHGGSITLAWDAPTSYGPLSYYIYAGTNAHFAATNYTVRVDAGTNLTCVVSNIVPGVWTFAATGGTMINCIAHHNKNAGFVLDGTQFVFGCIAVTNAGDGFHGTGDVQLSLINCTAFGNTGSGVNMAGASGTPQDPMTISIINCAFVGNAGAAITNAASTSYYCGGLFNNCIGSGTMTNAWLKSTFQGVLDVGTFALPANTTPWTAPLTGNFCISNTTAVQAAGYGSYLETYPGYGGTVGYPDVGAGQSASTNAPAGSASSEHSAVFSQ